MLLRVMFLFAGACAVWAGPSQTWRIDYSYSGGLAGLVRRITVTDDGNVTVVDGLSRPAEARFAATPAEMAKIVAALRELNLSGPPRALPPARPMPDAFTSSLKVLYGGQEYPIGEAGAALVSVLEPILIRGLQRAADENWARAGTLRLGRVWDAKIEVRDDKGMWHGEYWHGVWTRRGDTQTFDAVWRNTRTNEELRETVTLDSAERGHVLLHRSTGNQTMEGTYWPEHQDRLAGFLTSGPHWYWEAAMRDDQAH